MRRSKPSSQETTLITDTVVNDPIRPSPDDMAAPSYNSHDSVKSLSLDGSTAASSAILRGAHAPHERGGGLPRGGRTCACVCVCACALTHLQECSCDSTSVLGESEHEATTHQGKHWAFPCCQFDRGEVKQRAGQIIPPPHPPPHTHRRWEWFPNCTNPG